MLVNLKQMITVLRVHRRGKRMIKVFDYRCNECNHEWEAWVDHRQPAIP